MGRGYTICEPCSLDNMRAMAEQHGELAGALDKITRAAELVKCFTVENPFGIEIQTMHGLVMGNSSKIAWSGLNSQATRLTIAYDGALQNLRYEAASMGANAIVGIRVAVNNSSGSSANLGSSEAVVLLGTAITIL